MPRTVRPVSLQYIGLNGKIFSKVYRLSEHRKIIARFYIEAPEGSAGKLAVSVEKVYEEAGTRRFGVISAH
jgi:hypothetical protein